MRTTYTYCFICLMNWQRMGLTCWRAHSGVMLFFSSLRFFNFVKSIARFCRKDWVPLPTCHCKALHKAFMVTSSEDRLF